MLLPGLNKKEKSFSSDLSDLRSDKEKLIYKTNKILKFLIRTCTGSQWEKKHIGAV